MKFGAKSVTTVTDRPCWDFMPYREGGQTMKLLARRMSLTPASVYPWERSKKLNLQAESLRA